MNFAVMESHLKQNSQLAQANLAKEIEKSKEQLRHELKYFASYPKAAGFSQNALGFSYVKQLDPETSKPQYPRSAIIPSYIRVGELKSKNKVFVAPALIPFSTSAGLIVSSYRNSINAINMVQSLAVLLLASIKNKNCRIHLCDINGLGNNLNELRRLDKKLRGDTVTNSAQLGQLLDFLIATSNQRFDDCLAGRYNSVDDYNAHEATSLLPYQIVVITGYDEGFNDVRIEEKMNILFEHGARAGIHFLIAAEEITIKKTDPRCNLCKISMTNNEYQLTTNSGYDDFISSQFTFEPDFTLGQDVTEIITVINASLTPKAKNIVELFGDKPHRSSGKGKLLFPVAHDGDSFNLCFAPTIGPDGGMGSSALIAGESGSGKSALLHTIILSAAWHYAPSELEMYLLDFKQGMEFARYDTLPHAKVLSTVNDTHFGLNVLESLLRECARRSDVIKPTGAQGINSYNEVVQGKDRLPFILLVMDEFHLFTENSDRGRQALDDIVRQGRSYGIFVILATQSPGSNSLLNTTRDNMRIRISLSNKQSEYTIGNNEACYLEGFGKAILNVSGGKKESNVFFNVLDLGKNENEIPKNISRIVGVLQKTDHAIPFRHTFTSQQDMNTSWKDNPKLLSTGDVAEIPKDYKLYIGKPFSITDEHFSIQLNPGESSRSHIGLVGDFDSAVKLLSSISTQIARKLVVNSPNTSYLAIFDAGYKTELAAKNLQIFDMLCSGHSDKSFLISENDMELRSGLLAIANHLKRCENEEATNEFTAIILFNCFKSKTLRRDQEVRDALMYILDIGSEYNFHIIAYCRDEKEWGEIFGRYAISNKFENIIMLKGSSPANILQNCNLNKEPKFDNTAYVLTPDADYPILIRYYHDSLEMVAV